MVSSLKLKILKSPLLLKIVGLLSLLLYQLSFRLKVKGQRNILAFHPSTIFKGGSTVVRGNDNLIKIHPKVRLRRVKIEVFGSNNKLIINEGVKCYEGGYILFEGDNCTIELGRKTTIGSANIFCGESDTSIFIGKDCMLSRDIRLTTSDFHSIIDLGTRKRINPPKNIKVGDHVWIGNGSTIGKGSNVGSNSVIASRAFLSGKEFPSNSIVAGLPAKVLKEEIDWTRKKLPY